MKNVIFISSMGGHLNELLKLEKLFFKYNSMIVTEANETTKYLKDKYKDTKIEVKYLPYGTKKNLIKYLKVFTKNIFLSFNYVRKFRPDVVITTGTHTAVPLMYIAKMFGSKIVYIETFANIKKRTLAGILSSPVTDKMVVQWETLHEKYPKSEYWGGIF